MHLITSRGKSATFEGVYLEGDGPDTARDPGQEAVETSAALMGTAAYGQLTITSPGGTVKVRNGTVKLTDAGGGGNDDQSKWGFEFKRSGADV
jgi:hypothetical protein